MTPLDRLFALEQFGIKLGLDNIRAILAALGQKAWLPCAWLCKTLWPAQVDLARKTGAAVGVTNGLFATTLAAPISSPPIRFDAKLSGSWR